jgi:hypothetical protein
MLQSISWPQKECSDCIIMNPRQWGCNQTRMYKSPIIHLQCKLSIKASSIQHSDKLTPCSKVFQEKLVLVKEFPTSYGIQRYITMHTRASHWDLCWASIMSYFINIHFTITLPSMPRSPTWFLPFRFSNQNSVWNFYLPHVCNMSYLPHL